MASERLSLAEPAEKHGSHSCDIATANLPRLEDVDIQAGELLFLEVFRLLCSDLAQSSTKGWRTSLRLAEARFGAWKGLSFVKHVTGLTNAIRMERTGRFSYMPVECATCSCHLSEDEQMTLKLLRTAYGPDHEGLVETARLLSGNADPIGISKAAILLGKWLPAAQEQKVH